MKSLSASRRRRVEARAAELIAKEMTLRELRKARKVTQVRIARALGIRQDEVSRLEKRNDLLLSTLRMSTSLGLSSTYATSEGGSREKNCECGIAP